MFAVRLQQNAHTNDYYDADFLPECNNVHTLKLWCGENRAKWVWERSMQAYEWIPASHHGNALWINQYSYTFT